jgi:threonine/homoserine/homoserine lactone efflux protein
LSSLLVGFSGALMPGPLFAAVVAGVAGGGFLAGPALVTGHALLELIVVIAVARGLGPLLRRPAVTRAIAGCGGAVLLWLAWGMIQDGLAQRVVAGPAAGSPAGGASVLVGALVSVSNPYWLLWWATAGASYVALALSRGVPGLAAVYTGHILSDYSWYGAVALAVAAGRSVLGPAAYNAAAVIAGAFLVVMALLFIWAAVRPARAGEAAPVRAAS